MPRIFISYRREDSQWPARTLRDALAPHVRDPRSDIFMDIDNIPLGVNFADHVDSQIAGCDVVLALIGPKWTSVADAAGKRRLDDPADFVRLEIGRALKRGIPVVPVLLDDARMPTPAELPEDLRDLAMRNATQVRHATFNADAERLIQGLNLGASKAKAAPKAAARPSSAQKAKQSSGGSGGIIVAVVLLLLVGGGIGGYFAMGDPLHLLNKAEPELSAQAPAEALPSAAPTGPAPNVAQIGPPPVVPTQSDPVAAPMQSAPSAMIPPSPAKGPPPVPAPQTAASPNVNGYNLQKVVFNGGKAWFAQTGDKAWTEYGEGGKEGAHFKEVARDDWSVYLSDDGRKMTLQLDIFRNMIGLSLDGKPITDWQKIEASSKTPG